MLYWERKILNQLIYFLFIFCLIRLWGKYREIDSC